MKKKILIVDDDEAIVEVLTIILRDEGYTTFKAYDGKTAMSQLKRKPDLVLLDIRMSGTDGGYICKLIKKGEKTKNIPVILASANNNAKSIAKESGADNYISKPFDMEDVLKMIEKSLRLT